MLYCSVIWQFGAGIPSSIATDASPGAMSGVNVQRPSPVNIDQYCVLDCGMKRSVCLRSDTGRREISRNAVTMGVYPEGSVVS